MRTVSHTLWDQGYGSSTFEDPGRHALLILSAKGSPIRLDYRFWHRYIKSDLRNFCDLGAPSNGV